MSDLTENVDLRWIECFLLGMQDRLRIIGDDVAEMKIDLREIGGRVAVLKANYARVSFRVDRLGDRLDRIERRRVWSRLKRVGWVEQRDTHRLRAGTNIDGFRCAQPILRLLSTLFIVIPAKARRRPGSGVQSLLRFAQVDPSLAVAFAGMTQ